MKLSTYLKTVPYKNKEIIFIPKKPITCSSHVIIYRDLLHQELSLEIVYRIAINKLYVEAYFFKNNIAHTIFSKETDGDDVISLTMPKTLAYPVYVNDEDFDIKTFKANKGLSMITTRLFLDPEVIYIDVIPFNLFRLEKIQ